MIRDYMAEEQVDENNDALNSLRKSIINGSQSGTSNKNQQFRNVLNIHDKNSSAP